MVAGAPVFADAFFSQHPHPVPLPQVGEGTLRFAPSHNSGNTHTCLITQAVGLSKVSPEFVQYDYWLLESLDSANFLK